MSFKPIILITTKYVSLKIGYRGPPRYFPSKPLRSRERVQSVPSLQLPNSPTREPRPCEPLRHVARVFSAGGSSPREPSRPLRISETLIRILRGKSVVLTMDDFSCSKQQDRAWQEAFHSFMIKLSFSPSPASFALRLTRGEWVSQALNASGEGSMAGMSGEEAR